MGSVYKQWAISYLQFASFTVFSTLFKINEATNLYIYMYAACLLI